MVLVVVSSFGKSADIVTAVESLALEEHQPAMHDGPLVEWRHDEPIVDDIILYIMWAVCC